MSDRELMRASDNDRQQVVDWLRQAHEDGRLKLDEFTERVGLAYQAVTYAELAKLHADLPGASPAAASPAARSVPVPAAVSAPAAADRRSAFADLPTPLKVLWTIWLAAVSINVVVWVLVVATAGHFVYLWPLWVAGPAGAALFGVSAPVLHNKRHRPPAALPRPPGGNAAAQREVGS